MYRKRPNVTIKEPIELINEKNEILSKLTKGNAVDRLAIETYPGVDKSCLIEEVQQNFSEYKIIDTDELYWSPARIMAALQEDLTDDQAFGRFSHKDFSEFFDYEKIRQQRELNKGGEKVIVIGVGAADVLDYEVLAYVDITRWEVQLRYKEGLMNWQGFREESFAEKLKRAYYFDWPAADFRRRELVKSCDYYLDGTDHRSLKMIHESDLEKVLSAFIHQPFRLVPYFDPGVWGGNWMQEKFDVGANQPNLGWSFDGVPEENSILAKIGEFEFEMPAQLLVNSYPEELLGEKVYGRFGRDFPIRFDYLDTIDGQNLSLQVHPTLDYAYRKFGAKYTQDESYYILDCKEDAVVYLGVKDEVDKNGMISALKKAQETGTFDEERYVNKFSVKKHDHFLIPAGTVHSSGKNCVVLEISATPNRFTFKLWDWGRLDLDGKPRPISIDHGEQVINTDFNETFAKRELINAVTVIQKEEGFLEEKTGLHVLEAIETRRLTFSKTISLRTESSVNMLNLVEGEQIVVTSPDGKFEPFDIYYGETFIIPEIIGDYLLTPVDGQTVKVMKAYIR
ncbi:class I mannose-6-phosphate isomerase [Candidatus Enterococcus clewellii]|uniref:Mannose-6-phosphate isomerase n=1 Tax=Candidatus Enterococcus clewellii TaxID=1834193 RepID=A0A242KF72_9ENTE|nr:class I mannose-6-phosphate isomerase [Enterococcus sp. 9E7_DIV0242]OTP19428.1 hypothetical protein A5888_001245 [Enterococcus sp. 9E7_DIV0242]